jgi:hypothetical protein
MVCSVRQSWRMGGKVVAYKNDTSPYNLAYVWHGGSDNLVCPSILAYGVAWRSRARMVEVHPFWRMGWHGGSDALIGPSILAYGWHCGRMQE